MRFLQRGPQTPGDGFHRLGGAIIVLQRSHVLIEVGGSSGTATERVHLRPGQAVKIVKLHRRQRRAQIHQLGRWLVQFPALVIGADDEHAHVQPPRGLDGRPVQIVDEIPVQVDVIEFTAADAIQNNVRGGVRGEPDEATATLALQLLRRFQAAAFAYRPVEQFPVVDPVQRQQIHVIQLQVGHGFLKRLQEFPGICARRHFGLNNQFLTGERWQNEE